MWSILSYNDPVLDNGTASEKPRDTFILKSEIEWDALVQEPSHRAILKEGGREAAVALADFCARQVALSEFEHNFGALRVLIEPLDRSMRSKQGVTRNHQVTMFPLFWSAVTFIVKAKSLLSTFGHLYRVLTVLQETQKFPTRRRSMEFQRTSHLRC